EGVRRQRRLRDSEERLLCSCRLFSLVDQLLVGCLQLKDIDQSTRQILAVARLVNANLLEHLTNDDLDMLIVDINTLQTIYTLYLPHHVILNGTDTFNLQDIMRIDGTFGQLIAGLQMSAVKHLDSCAIRDDIG